MKWVGRAVIAVLVFVLVAAVAGFFWLRTGLPPYDGTVRLAGLQAPVQIMRDEHAVPHIFAANEADAYFALGYVHAQDRLWQMDRQRRVGAGRLAEVYGSFALPFDRFMRAIGAYRRAEAEVEALPDEARAALESYAAGVNAWLDSHDGALPPEFNIPGFSYRPEPWRPADSMVWGKLMALLLSDNFRRELTYYRLLDVLSVAQLDDLYPPVGAPPTTLAHAASGPALDRLAASPPPFRPQSASNAWVISGDHTDTGAPLLANDPHLGLETPILWYLARIETPTLQVAGATVPGVPFMLIGHNGSIAWGMTTTGIDVQDLFVERLDPEDSTRYLTPDGSAPFQTREETIVVAGDEPETLIVRETRHGPVISDVNDDAEAAVDDGQVIALAFTALQPNDTTALALYRMGRATTVADFVDAARGWRAPLQNMLVADTAGSVGFIVPGLIPIRAAGNGRLPAPGWTGENDWVGFIPFDELPQVIDPADGIIINANNRAAPPDYPYELGAPYAEAYRARRLTEVLTAGDRQSVASTEALVMDSVSLAARDLLPLLLEADAETPRAANARALLRSWDHTMARDRPEPLIFIAWLVELNRGLYADELGELADDYVDFRPTAVRRMLTDAAAWCDDVTTEDTAETCAAIIAAALDRALERLASDHGDNIEAWRWGDAHIAPLAHQVFSRVPLINLLWDQSIATDGGPFTVNRGGANINDIDNPFQHRHGAGLRAIFDLADLDNSRFIIATGQSGHPMSPHYGSLRETWRDGGHITIAGTPTELAERGTGTLTLRPLD